jgi:hypothetical protein
MELLNYISSIIIYYNLITIYGRIRKNSGLEQFKKYGEAEGELNILNQIQDTLVQITSVERIHTFEKIEGTEDEYRLLVFGEKTGNLRAPKVDWQ